MDAVEVRPHTGAAPVSRADGDKTENNFHLLRLIFALMVVGYHLIALPLAPEWAGVEGSGGLAAQVGVEGFFVLSGYLVYGSLERSPSLRIYAEKRIRRLYPAYATIILLSVLAALVFSAEARADLLAVARYLGWNLVFLNFMEPNLPGVFAANRFHEVNGALWTLKIEVAFYVVLPLLAWAIRLAGKWRWLLIAAMYVGAEAWRYGFELRSGGGADVVQVQVARQLPGQLSFFITGVGLYLARDRLALTPGTAILAAIALFFTLFYPELAPLRAISLGVLAVFLAVRAPHPFDAARFGDVSYGLYIIHFPIIQILTAAGLFAASPWLGAAAALAGSLVLALLLWRYVERPFLRPDSAYRRAANPA